MASAPEQPVGTGSVAPQESRSRKWWRPFLRVVFVISVVLNIILLAAVSERQARAFREILVEGKPQVKQKVVVLPIRGLIGTGMASDVRRMLEQIEEDREDVRGLILRIDSPGGTVTATDRIYHALRKFIEKKRSNSTASFPVVASIEGLGASGAYYIATVADEILVEPAGLTGSIGVRLTLVNVSDLTQKVGIEVQDVKTGPFKDAGSPFRPLTEEEKDRFQELVQHYFQMFVDVVRTGRGERLETTRLDRITNGDVFVADEALDLGLVDQIGYFEDAVARARELTGLENVKVVELRKWWSWSELFQLQTFRKMVSWQLLLPHEDPGVAVPQAYYLYGQTIALPYAPMHTPELGL